MKLAVLSTLLSTIAALDITSLLEFDRPLLEILDTKLSHSFKCRLKEKPSVPVQIYFEAQGISFDNCMIEIDVESYNQWKEIKLIGLPVFDTLSDVDFSIKGLILN